MKPFCKPALSVTEQLTLLENRNLLIKDSRQAKQFLEVISLFRLTPYMRPFQDQKDPKHIFVNGTTLQHITDLYFFDRQLRSLVMEAIEPIEVATRAKINNHMSTKYGTHWYTHKKYFKNHQEHAKLLENLNTKQQMEKRHYQREVTRIKGSKAEPEIQKQRIEQRKRDNYFRYYCHTYTSPDLPPSWAVLEELSLGTLSYLYKNIALDQDRKKIANQFNLPKDVFSSWLHTLTFIRNICAHHARLWNREIAITPKIPKILGTQASNRRLPIILEILDYMTKNISPEMKWKEKLNALINESPTIIKSELRRD